MQYLDGPLKGVTQSLGSSEVWSREKFITPQQAEQLGVQLDNSVFEDAKKKALDKGKKYTEEQKKAAIAAEKKAAKQKAEIKEKAEKEALKSKSIVNGPGFSVETLEATKVDWSFSADKNVPSLESALRLANGDNAQSAAIGSATLVDADKIEDLEVRVQKVTGKQGVEKIRLTFKLTDWAGNAAAAKAMNNVAVKSSDRMNVEKWKIEDDGKLVRSGIWGSSFVDSNHLGTTFSGKAGSGDFKLHRAVKSAESPDFYAGGNYGITPVSFHNTVELYLPGNATSSDVQKALEQFGAIGAPRPASVKDVKGLIENKMIWLYGSETDGTTNFTGELRQKELDSIQNKYGFTADDVEISVDGGGYGRINYLVPEGVAKKIIGESKFKHFQHNWTNTTESLPSGGQARAEYFYKVFREGLTATVSRWMNGINTEGMSSKTDVKAVGGSYMFTHPKSSVSTSSSYSTISFYFDGVKMMRRMDWFKTNSDAYGKMESGAENNIAKLNDIDGQVMFKKNFIWSDLSGIQIDSETRKVLIEMLTAPDNVIPNAEAIVDMLKKGN